jgi:hypothetical protein
MNIDELLAQARLAEDEVQVCLRPDLLADYKSAVTAHEEADRAQKADGSLEATEKLQAAAVVDDVRDRMLAASVTFRVRALPQRRWSSLYAEHPPRDGDQDDQRVGFNRDTFYDVLVRECVVDPSLTGEQWTLLLDKLSAAQYASLKTKAWLVNNADVDVPFLLIASRGHPNTATGSEPPEGSESLSGDSTDGSPSPTTPTTTPAVPSRPARSRNGTATSRP